MRTPPPSCTCEVACAETVNESCQVCSTEVGQCTAAQQQEPVQQESEQEQKTETCTHGNDPETCEACASAKKVAQVQAQIDALPETVTAESKEAAQSALSAVDTAKAELTAEQQAQLDMTQYTALTQKLAALESPAPSATGNTTEKTAKVITAWAWIDEEGYLDEETGNLALPGASEEMPASFDDVVFFLPYEITATVDGVEETLTIDWVCDNYPEDGAYEGEYTFTATLPEGYALDEGVQALTVDVLLGGIKRYATGISYMTWDGSQKKLVSATCSSATEVTGSESDTAITWGQTGQTTWYVVNSDLTIGKNETAATLACITVKGNVNLILADDCTLTVYGRIEVNDGTGTLAIYGQSGGTGALNLPEISESADDFTHAVIGSRGKVDDTDHANSTTITINGGCVSVIRSIPHQTQSNRACIGGGNGGSAKITINGGTVVVNGSRYFLGQLHAAAIGGGNGGNADITINDCAEIRAYAGTGGPCIGSYSGAAKITINGGDNIKAYGVHASPGIGVSGKDANLVVNISGGNVQTNNYNGAGIGSGALAENITGSINITGGKVYPYGIQNGAGIGSGRNSKTLLDVNISGGIVNAKGYVGNSGTLYYGPGIGAAQGSTMGDINISGGEVYFTRQDGTRASGIGVAEGGSMGKITISGGTVDTGVGSYQCAGIGSGPNTKNPEIVISGGNVTAKGGSQAAGIGGGYSDSKDATIGTITISGGVVNAKGDWAGAGIGGGYHYSKGTINLTGGIINAERGTQGSQLDKEACDVGLGGNWTVKKGMTINLNGTALLLYKNSLGSDMNKNLDSGMLSMNGSFDVYGNQTLPCDFTVPSGKNLSISTNGSLTASNYKLYVNGTPENVTDTNLKGNVFFPLTLENCLVEGAAGATETVSNQLYGKIDTAFTIKATEGAGYRVSNITTDPAITVTNNSFSMPRKALKVSAQSEKVLEITQQPVGATITYGQSATLSVTAQNASGNTSGISYNWYVDGVLKGNGSSLTLSNLDAGSYSFYCEVACDGITVKSNTATVTVEKAQARVTIDSDPSKTYDGKPVDPPGYTVIIGGGFPKIEYKLQSEPDTAYTETPPMDAGEYTVRATMLETQNYKGASDTQDFTIRKATDNEWQTEPYVTDFIYGETATNPVTYQALYGNDKVKITYKKQGTEDAPSTDVPTEAGTYDVTFSVEETSNYSPKLEATNLTLTIAKADSSVTKAPEDAKSLYTGNPVPLVTAGTAEGGTMHYSLDGVTWSADIPTATDWKTYTVYYKVVGDNNHNNTEAQSLTAEIVPFKVAQTQDAVKITYGQDAALSVNPNTNLPDEISYQWYQVTGSEGDVELSGETANKLTIIKPIADTYTFVCKVTCGDYFKYSTVPVEVKPVALTNVGLSGYWAEGGEREIEPNETVKLTNPSSRLLTKYTTTPNDQGGLYPTGMQVFELNESNNPEEIPALENLLQYSGCSIRINGKPGIRMITSLTKEAKELLKKGELAGYTLEAYGTVAQWSMTLGGQPLTLSTGNPGVAYDASSGKDPIFGRSGGRVQYTNVLVWDELDDKQYNEDIVMRPFIKLRKGTQELVIYGGTVSRSIGYVAQQNADTFPVGSAGYKYVHDIIDKVANLNPSNESTTTAGG